MGEEILDRRGWAGGCVFISSHLCPGEARSGELPQGFPEEGGQWCEGGVCPFDALSEPEGPAPNPLQLSAPPPFLSSAITCILRTSCDTPRAPSLHRSKCFFKGLGIVPPLHMWKGEAQSHGATCETPGSETWVCRLWLGVLSCWSVRGLLPAALLACLAERARHLWPHGLGSSPSSALTEIRMLHTGQLLPSPPAPPSP